MTTDLDLDDVTADHPKARAEYIAMRDECNASRAAAFKTTQDLQEVRLRNAELAAKVRELQGEVQRKRVLIWDLAGSALKLRADVVRETKRIDGAVAYIGSVTLNDSTTDQAREDLDRFHKILAILTT